MIPYYINDMCVRHTMHNTYILFSACRFSRIIGIIRPAALLGLPHSSYSGRKSISIIVMDIAQASSLSACEYRWHAHRNLSVSRDRTGILRWCDCDCVLKRIRLPGYPVYSAARAMGLLRRFHKGRAKFCLASFPLTGITCCPTDSWFPMPLINYAGLNFEMSLADVDADTVRSHQSWQNDDAANKL